MPRAPGAAIAVPGRCGRWERLPGREKGGNSPCEEKICGQVAGKGPCRGGGGRVGSQSCCGDRAASRGEVTSVLACPLRAGRPRQSQHGVRNNPGKTQSQRCRCPRQGDSQGAPTRSVRPPCCHTPVAPPEVPLCVRVHPPAVGQSPKASRPRGWHGGPSRATPAVPVPTVALWCRNAPRRRELSLFSWLFLTRLLPST